MVTAVLVSPDFLYRGIAQPQKDTKFYALNDLELASRLSFFLWKRAPDDELLTLAKKGELQRPSVLDAQVRRMLAAPQAESLLQRLGRDRLSAARVVGERTIEEREERRVHRRGCGRIGQG